MVKEYNLSGKEKAMVFLTALGDEASAKLLQCLPDAAAQRISRELNFFPKPNKEMIAYVMKELSKLALSPAPEERTAMAATIEQQLSEQKKPAVVELQLPPLEKLTPQELLQKLQNEQVQTIAYVLSLLSEGHREHFYQLLSPGRRTEISNLPVIPVSIQKMMSERITNMLVTTPG